MAKTSLTLEDIAKMDCMFLIPDEAAVVLECDRGNINVMAATQEGREALGFRVVRIGSHTKIPRIPFLRFMGWEGEIRGAKEA